MERGDLDILHSVSRYREYLEETYWQGLSEKYAELYLQAANDINHHYIELVRLVINTV